MEAPTHARTTSRAFSHRSDKSNGSRSKSTADVAESPADKQRRDSFWRGGSKANPNAAMNEVQPGDAAMTEKSTLESLRNIQHKDANGNVITEPDLCNPTRPRWERPLDTIRSFERAIDGGYKRRSVSRSESYGGEPTRRSSYYGHGNNNDSGRHDNGSQYHAGYYGPRRSDGYSDAGASPAAPPSRNRFGQRINASRSNSAYGFSSPQPAYNDSHEAGHSDSTGQWGNSTDPSSENSSIERAQNGAKPNEPYAHDIHNGAPIMEEYASDSDGGYGMSWGKNRNAYNGGPTAAPQQSQAPPVRAPISLGGGPGAIASQGGTLPSTARPTPVKEEKKKGFFKKRFSKA